MNNDCPKGDRLDLLRYRGSAALADKVTLRADDWSEVEPYPAGAKISRFTIVEPIGRGGCGAVYLAQEEKTSDGGVNRQVALKVLRPEIADEDLIERFESEIDALARLNHANIINVYSQGISDVHSEGRSEIIDEGVYWFTTPYFPDGDAGQGLSAKKKFGLKRVARILHQVASALDNAYNDEGILHRDVKPRNILVRNREKKDESVVLADFGIAKWIARNTALTLTHVPVGTARYSSPEQIAQKELDGRSDQFSLACTAFELLTGSPLYRNSSKGERNKNIPNVSDLRKGFPKEIDTVLKKALSERPFDRYASCAEFARAFSEAIPEKKIIGNGAKDKEPGSKKFPFRMWSTHRRVRLAAGALALVVAVCVIGVFWPTGDDLEVNGGKIVQDSTPLPDWKNPTYWDDSPVEVPFTNIPDGIFSAELAVDHEGDVYIAANNIVKKMTSDSGGKSMEDTLPFPSVSFATGLDIDESGVVFVLDGINNIVYKWEEGYPISSYLVDKVGGIDFFAKAGDAYYQIESEESGEAAARNDEICTMPGFRSAHAVEAMKSTNGKGFCRSFPVDLVNFTVSRDGTIYAVGRNLETGAIQLFVSSRGESEYKVRSLPQIPIYDLAVSGEGALYFTATYSSDIFKLSPGSSVPEVIYSFPSGYQGRSQPQSIAVGDNGNIYTRVGNRIWRIFEK